MKYIRLLFILAFVASCTITKRVHNPGWYVEWKSTHSSVRESEQVAADESMIERQTLGQTFSEQKHEGVKGTSENSNFQETTTLSEQKDQLDGRALPRVQGAQFSRSYSKLEEAKDEPDSGNGEPGTQKVHPMANAALFFLILSIPTLGLMLPLTVVLAVLALKKIKSNPNQWRGRGRALASLIIAVFLLFIVFVGLAVLGGGFSIM